MTDAPKQTWREAQAQREQGEYEAAFGIPMVEFSIPDAMAAAQEAIDAGYSLFQMEVPIGWSQGAIGIGTHSTRYKADPRPGLLSGIEGLGWRLEHMDTAFVSQGSVATKRAFANAGSTLVSDHGLLLGIYIFRRSL